MDEVGGEVALWGAEMGGGGGVEGRGVPHRTPPPPHPLQAAVCLAQVEA